MRAFLSRFGRSRMMPAQNWPSVCITSAGLQRPELLSHAKMHGGQRIKNVTQTTKDNIARIVANGIEAGIGREKMADEILQEYEIQSRSAPG